MKYGLIGEKLSHSFSKEIHEALTDYEYEIRELSPDEVAPFLEARAFCGINVTIPYKEKVIPYLDSITDEARKIGAVNTIKNVNGRLIGDNTDFYGMREMILRANIGIAGKKVLILGTGGTSKTSRAVAADLGASEIITVSRNAGNGTVSYNDAVALHGDADVIINTTPLGMYPNPDAVAIDIRGFKKLSGVIDAVYNPLRTKLVLEAETLRIPATGGLMMLILQAARAAEIFLGYAIDENKIEEVIKIIFKSKENIVLIGMPGCGKSTIGAAIAEITGRKLTDTDTLIEEMTGKHPSAIIREMGEPEFRRIETEAVKQASKMSGVIIACGGGVVTRAENITLLRQNGKIFYLDCPTDELALTPDRPLSQSLKALNSLYAVRAPLYHEAADSVIPISHRESPLAAANKIMNTFTELI